MWLKQIQVFQLSKSEKFHTEKLKAALEELAFTECLPSMPNSAGWVPPVGEDDADAPLVRKINENYALCLQVEEKILPATVVNDELTTVVKQLETSESRKVRQKEKLDLKDQITQTMLPRAFSKKTKIYAYIDNTNHWLILGTASARMTEKFFDIFKKSVTDDVFPPQLVKPSYVLTRWVLNKDYPTSFDIESSGVLQDQQKENRIIRCQQQDLFAESIQQLLVDGCEVIQLALSWHDQVKFTLAKDFSLRSIQFADELIEQVKDAGAETETQKFDANFFMMCGTFAGLLNELLELFSEKNNQPAPRIDIKPDEEMLKTA